MILVGARLCHCEQASTPYSYGNTFMELDNPMMVVRCSNKWASALHLLRIWKMALQFCLLAGLFLSF